MPERCVVCGGSTISFCPYCLLAVCFDYAQKDCGTKHEGSCPPAREARLADPPPRQEEPSRRKPRRKPSRRRKTRAS